MINQIEKYFPSLSGHQKQQFRQMMELYPLWNEKINVISRKDIDNLEINHILHSLSIAKFIDFKPGTRVLDLGCGGGLPGLPLAIIFPETTFTLVDRVGKKVRVAREVADALELHNVECKHGDSGECQRRYFDFVVSRAVMAFPELVMAAKPHISSTDKNGYPNGLISLKGGELSSELGRYKNDTLIVPLKDMYPNLEFFKTKVLTYTPLKP